MSIVRYRQWQSEPVISDGLRQMIDSLGRVAPGQRSDVWVPAVDIVDEPTRLLLQADLPGIDPAAIELLVEGNELEPDSRAKAREEGLAVLATEKTAYEACGLMMQAGVAPAVE